jgi:lipopolysaccharide biosynthesis regulator YciM
VTPDGSSLLFWCGLLACASIVLYAVSRGGPRTPVAPDHYRTALHRLVHDDPSGAIESLRLLIQSGRAPADAYIQMGNLLRQRGDYVAAFQIHQSLTVRQDLSVEEQVANLRALADDYRSLGQREEALATLQRLVGLRRDAATLRELAREALIAERHEEAWAALRDAAKLDPGIGRSERAAFLAVLGARLHARGQSEAARHWYQLALKEDDTDPQALDGMGELAAAAGDLESALYYWQKLVFAGAPAEVNAKLERVYFELGKFGEIERVYAQILEKRPKDVQTLLAAARIALKKGEAEDAERLLKSALEAAPDSAVVLYLLSTVYLDGGRLREARELLAALAARLPAGGRGCGRDRCPHAGAGLGPGYCIECGRFGRPEGEST